MMMGYICTDGGCEKVLVVKQAFVILLLVLLVPLRLAALTRDEVVSAAKSEAGRTYDSATSNELLLSNYFHENYGSGGDCPGCSTLPECSYAIGDTDTTVHKCSWSGAPYCFGGNIMGDNCQSLISDGYALGAHRCHYNNYGENINSWAAGIDCAAFVGECLRIGTNISTSDLPSHCQQIQWDDLQPGDLIIDPGNHVLMFIAWVNQATGDMTVAEAVTWSSNYHYDKVVKHEVNKRGYSSYSPYKPNCIAGGLAARVAGFRVEVEGGLVHLSWKTECERDTDCFWIERSFSEDGPWERITGEISAKGTSTSGAKYEVVDESYGGGRAFYRLMERETGYRILVNRIEVCESDMRSSGK